MTYMYMYLGDKGGGVHFFSKFQIDITYYMYLPTERFSPSTAIGINHFTLWGNKVELIRIQKGKKRRELG